MPKRTKFDSGGNEDDYVKKCMECKYSYTRQNESDSLFCARKKGCIFEENEGSNHERSV